MSVYYDMAGLSRLTGISRQKIRYHLLQGNITAINTKRWRGNRYLFSGNHLAEAIDFLENFYEVAEEEEQGGKDEQEV